MDRDPGTNRQRLTRVHFRDQCSVPEHHLTVTSQGLAVSREAQRRTIKQRPMVIDEGQTIPCDQYRSGVHRYVRVQRYAVEGSVGPLRNHHTTTSDRTHRATFDRAAEQRDRLMRDEHIIYPQHSAIERDRIERFNRLHPHRPAAECDRRAGVGVDQHDITSRWQPPTFPVGRIVPVAAGGIEPLNRYAGDPCLSCHRARQTKGSGVGQRVAFGTRRQQHRGNVIRH